MDYNFKHLDEMSNDELHDYMYNDAKSTEQWLELMAYSTSQWSAQYNEIKTERDQLLRQNKKLKISLQRATSVIIRNKKKCTKTTNNNYPKISKCLAGVNPSKEPEP